MFFINLPFAAAALALAGGAVFVRTGRRSPDPMLPLSLFGQPEFRSGTAVGSRPCSPGPGPPPRAGLGRIVGVSHAGVRRANTIEGGRR